MQLGMCVAVRGRLARRYVHGGAWGGAMRGCGGGGRTTTTPRDQRKEEGKNKLAKLYTRIIVNR
jgi:hypothetical protein